MTRKFEFAVVRLTDKLRGETLNAALAIFDGHSVDVRLPRRLEKLRAMSQALDVEEFRKSVCRIDELDTYAREAGAADTKDRLIALRHLTSFEFSELAWFDAPTHDAYETCAQLLVRQLIEPEPQRLTAPKKRTRLLTLIKHAFRTERVLARKGENLDSHRIVMNYAIAEGLEADFLLRNGAMHVIETVDASDQNTPPRRVVSDIAISALVLEQARMTFGENSTIARLVYDASASLERIAAPSLNAAAHQGAQLVNWASGDDRRKLLVDLSTLATPLENRTSKATPHLMATNQPRLALN